MHVNLFSQGHSRREVKDALNRHQKRDSGVLRALDFALALSVLYLVRNLPRFDAVAIGVAIGVAIFAGVSGLRYFIDQSVRNFYLHRLDWEDAEPHAGSSGG